MRISGLLLLIATGVITASAGCASDPGAVECATGIFCPSGTHCAATQKLCIANTLNCGNLVMDDGEECDDGNLDPGDGCSPTCKIEICGNLNPDPGEQCDDGNTASGDGCSSTCKNEFCGNNIQDPGEACDEGPTGGLHCNALCTSDLSCGNGVKDPGEACDIPGDLAHCSADCLSSLACGNGQIDPGEECDNGSTDDGITHIFNANDQDCRVDCVINRCGDGFQDTKGAANRREACDPATQAPAHSSDTNPTETADCNLDCTGFAYGDGIINKAAGEQCDDGVNNGDDRDCTAHGQVARCGDGLPDTAGTEHTEMCDDGNADETDGCNQECATPSCGNGIVDKNEQCDLGMGLNGDDKACTGNCQISKCGDGKVRAGVEECDGAPVGVVPCNNATCKLQKCGNGTIDPGENCDDSNTMSGDGCSATCQVEFCGDGTKNQTAGKEQCDPGATAGTQLCNVNCTTPTCGDGIVNKNYTPPTGTAPEQCDPPNPGHGCSALCRSESCGNGVVDTGEQCDGALTTPPFSCVNCHLDKCGNGIVDADEECDDGNTNDKDSCISNDPTPSKCKLNKCGDGVLNTGVEQCDDGVLNGTMTSMCDTLCHTKMCGNGIIDFNESCDDGPGNNGPNKRCNGSCKYNTCGDSDVLTGVEQCDPGPGGDKAACDSDCTTNVCGDGHVNSVTEACDDGAMNGMPGHCSTNCTVASCGNGAVDSSTEQCDPGGTADTATCIGTSTPALECKDSFCGDGHKNPVNESCDDGALNGKPCAYSATGTCTRCKDDCTGTATFTGPKCGDGHQDTASGEACDDGNTMDETDADCPYGMSCSFCAHDCKTVISATGDTCNDATVDSVESCDDGNMSCGACSANCKDVLNAVATAVLATPGGANLTDGDNFTLNDGINSTSIKFQFYTGSAPATPTVGIKFVGGATPDSPATVRTNTISAINGVTGGLLITASPDASGFVKLTDDRNSVLGNTTPTWSANLGTEGFFITPFSGGAGGDCAGGQECTTDPDCASHNCVTATHKCAVAP